MDRDEVLKVVRVMRDSRNRCDCRPGIDGCTACREMGEAITAIESLYAENARLRAAVGGGWLPADQFPALTIRDDKPCEVNGRSIPPITYSEDVLVLLDNDSVGVDSAAKFDDRTVAFWRIYLDRVKAWQPLPPPPKEAKS